MKDDMREIKLRVNAMKNGKTTIILKISHLTGLPAE